MTSGDCCHIAYLDSMNIVASGIESQPDFCPQLEEDLFSTCRSLLIRRIITLSGCSCDHRCASGLAIDTSIFRILMCLFVLGQNHYPERLGAAVIVDAPRVFSLLWHAAKPSMYPALLSLMCLTLTNMYHGTEQDCQQQTIFLVFFSHVHSGYIEMLIVSLHW